MDASSQPTAPGHRSAARSSFSPRNFFAGQRVHVIFSDSLSNALCATIIAYCVLSFIAGQAGFLAYREVKADIIRMELQLEAFSLENAALLDIKESLSTDRDRIAREARSLGYIQPDEKIIQLSNIDTSLSAANIERLEPIRSGKSSGLPDGVIKLLSIITGIAILLASLVMGYSPRKKPEPIQAKSDGVLAENR
jgi:cell division protein FtsB